MPYLSYFFHFSFHLFPDSGAKCIGSRNLLVNLLCLLFTVTSLLCIHRFTVTLHPTIILALTINQSPICHQGITFLIFSVVTRPSLYVVCTWTRLNIWLLDKFSMSPLLCFVRSHNCRLKPKIFLSSLSIFWNHFVHILLITIWPNRIWEATWKHYWAKNNEHGH